MIPFQAPFVQNPNQNHTQPEPNKISPLPQVSASNTPTNQQDQPHSISFPTQPNNFNPFFVSFPNNLQQPHPQPQFFPQNSVGFQMPPHIINNPNFGAMSCLTPGQFFPNNQMHGIQQLGQFSVNNFPQNVNPFVSFPHNNVGFPQVNPFNMAVPNSGMNTSLGCVSHGSQNAGFPMNPQMVMANANQMHNVQAQNMLMPPNMGQNGFNSMPLNMSQNGSNPMIMNAGQVPMQQTQNMLQSGNPGKPQGTHTKDNEGNISNNNQSNPLTNGFARNPQESVKSEPGNSRFLKPNFHPNGNARGNSRSFRGRGPANRGGRNSYQSTKQETSVENQSSRKLALNYSEDEIRKWREERKKNHPSRINNDKKSEEQVDSEDTAAQTRRQQLKGILAKQAELGVEVAEIPRNYLLDSENQVHGTEQNGTITEKGRFKKRGGRRQKRGGMNRFNKKQKFDDNDSSPKPTFIKKNHSVLQKLLNPEIKRDKSHLLQAFKFMLLNNFFLDWPKKPLEFPSVTVKETEPDSVVIGKGFPQKLNEGSSAMILNNEVVEFKDPHGKDTLCEDVGGDHDGEDSTSEAESKGEEGEITD